MADTCRFPARTTSRRYHPCMEWVLAVLGGGGLVALGRFVWDRRAARRGDAAELEQLKGLVDEDVTLLGEELARLGQQVDGTELDAETRRDYQLALDSYESAQRAVPGLKSPDGISTLTDTLAAGRYAIACVQARIAGVPVPERRVPCFFNPQHGPSVADVLWNQPAHGTRKVPACAQDVFRLKAGEDPSVRYVVIGTRRVPYWEAGAAVAPYGHGYFTTGAGADQVSEAFLRSQARNIANGGVGGF